MSEVKKPVGEGVRDWNVADLLPVLEALRGLRFGSVELFIQDSRLVQIDRREKIRTVKG
jgi:hypothetical protein